MPSNLTIPVHTSPTSDSSIYLPELEGFSLSACSQQVDNAGKLMIQPHSSKVCVPHCFPEFPGRWYLTGVPCFILHPSFLTSPLPYWCSLHPSNKLFLLKIVYQFCFLGQQGQESISQHSSQYIIIIWLLLILLECFWQLGLYFVAAFSALSRKYVRSKPAVNVHQISEQCLIDTC